MAKLEPPSSDVESERVVAASVMFDAAALEAARGIGLRAEDFAVAGNRLVYEAAERLDARAAAPDPMLVRAELDAAGQLRRAGGEENLAQLAAGYAAPASAVPEHARRVVEAATRRVLAEIGDGLRQGAQDAARPVSEVLVDVERALGEVRTRGRRREALPFRDAVNAAHDRISQRAMPGAEPWAVPTGVPDLDRLTGGLEPGMLHLLAARPSQGKTALLMNVAEHVARVVGLAALVFSLEMAAEQLAERAVLGAADVPRDVVHHKAMKQDQWSRITLAVHRLGTLPILVQDAPVLRIGELAAEARRVARSERRLGLVIVDYIQLLVPDERAESRNDAVARISAGLKHLARELGVPVLAASQLSRATERRKSRKPMLADLRDSGALEQDADVVMLLARRESYSDKSEDKGLADLVVAKHRNGPTGLVVLRFDPARVRFYGVECGREDGDAPPPRSDWYLEEVSDA